MASQIPQRLKGAVEALDVQPEEQILEIGCGRGVAIELICAKLDTGRVTGVDRSPIAIAAAQSRNRLHVASGKARLLRMALAEAGFGQPFDKVFAVNVNVFWLNPARELNVIRRILEPGAKLYLFYEPPSRLQFTQVDEACRTFLQEHGFRVSQVLHADLPPNLGLCIVAAP